MPHDAKIRMAHFGGIGSCAFIRVRLSIRLRLPALYSMSLAARTIWRGDYTGRTRQPPRVASLRARPAVSLRARVSHRHGPRDFSYRRRTALVARHVWMRDHPAERQFGRGFAYAAVAYRGRALRSDQLEIPRPLNGELQRCLFANIGVVLDLR